MSNPFTNQYANSPEGVRQFLIEGVGIDVSGIERIVPDPYVRGTWGVVLKDSGKADPSIVVFLKGHSRSLMNDFECDEYAETNLM